MITLTLTAAVNSDAGELTDKNQCLSIRRHFGQVELSRMYDIVKTG